MIFAQSLIFQSMIAYGILETSVFLVILVLTIRIILAFKEEQTLMTNLIVFYFIFYTLAVGFSASVKFYWHYTLDHFFDNQLEFLFDSGYFYMFCILLGNLCYHFYYLKSFSKPIQWVDGLIFLYSFIFVVLTAFREFNGLYSNILLFIHAILIYIPSILQIGKYRKKSGKESQKNLNLLFKFALSVNIVWLFNLLDAIWDIATEISFGPFYYLIWIMVIIVLNTLHKQATNQQMMSFKEIKLLNFPNNQEEILSLRLSEETDVDKISTLFGKFEKSYHAAIEKSATGNSLENETHPQKLNRIFLQCPVCEQTGFFNLSPLLKKKILFTPSGISSLYIPPDFVCSHSFLIYVDRQYAVRSYQTFDIIIPGK